MLFGWAATILTYGDSSYEEQQGMAINAYADELAQKYGYESSHSLGWGAGVTLTTTYHKK